MPEGMILHQNKQPTENDLQKRLGRAFHLVDGTLEVLHSEYQDISFEWKFSKTSGWYLVYNRKKKRIFYLFPLDNDFTCKVVFNDKSLEKIKNGSFPKYVIEMIQNVKKYPEGTLCIFDKSNFKIKTMLRLLRIKIEN